MHVKFWSLTFLVISAATSLNLALSSSSKASSYCTCILNDPNTDKAKAAETKKWK